MRRNPLRAAGSSAEAAATPCPACGHALTEDLTAADVMASLELEDVDQLLDAICATRADLADLAGAAWWLCSNCGNCGASTGWTWL